ncbi:hypothetical protein [Spiroplasma poulsonii]|nr:hypothetical protein [Spiroplasma poulsonii]
MIVKNNVIKVITLSFKKWLAMMIINQNNGNEIKEIKIPTP